MPKRQRELLTSWWRGIPPAALVALAFWLGSASHDLAFAQSSFEDATTAEGWAWSKISNGEWADFNKRCDPEAPPFDPKVDDVHWQDDCRKLAASFLQDLLTKAPWRESTPFAGVRVKGARIVNNLRDPQDLDLENTKLIRSLEINGSRIEATINLAHVHADSFLSFNSSVISNGFEAEGLGSSSDLSLRDDVILKVNLRDAKIDGNVDMRGTSLDGVLDATALRVNGTLDMSSSDKHRAWFKKDVKLDSAKIGGNVQMFGLVLLCHKLALWQQGHLGSRRAIVRANLMRMLVMDDLTWRSVRIGGSAGSKTVG